MRLLLNGAEHELPDGSSVADALTVLGAPTTGVAVAVDDDVVPRAEWATHELRDGAAVEVLTAVQGG
ncbi:MAG TPA: sulfur carrier protein ThiS [Pseudonocardiaceae bacterium]|jgi:sulfur carrier protein